MLSIWVPQLSAAPTLSVYLPLLNGALIRTENVPARRKPKRTTVTTWRCLLMAIATLAPKRRVILTLKILPRMTFWGDLNLTIGVANLVLNVLSAPLVRPSGLVATSLKWYLVHGASPLTLADTGAVAGVVQYPGGKAVCPGWQAPSVCGGICFPYAVVVPYWKNHCVGSPPATLAPAVPFSAADRALTLVALRVTATGGTLMQYGPSPPLGGGECPGVQTMVAPAGATENATTAAATKPPKGTSRLRYLVMYVLLIGKRPRSEGLSLLTRHSRHS